jgi:hypothetical protein
MSGASVDLRGFVFTFEGLLRKYQWELDALHARMAAAYAQMKSAADELEKLQATLDGHGADINQALANSLNPFLHQRSIGYLASARSTIAEREKKLIALKQAHEALREACLEKQRKIEMLKDVQEQQLLDFVLAEQTRLANESDRDWSARNVARTRSVKASAAGVFTGKCSL